MFPFEPEEWREVPSLPALSVSSLGRIMRTPWRAPGPGGRGMRTYGGKPGWGAWDKRQRRFVHGYQGKTYRVARLVCEAFHGPPPFEGAVSMHRDENAANNAKDNLCWGTQRENLNAPGFIRYCHARRRPKRPT